MPYTINGFGTQYYGKSNCLSWQGTCEDCGRQVKLSTYDTVSYFTVLFFPLIPMGKKRVMNDCSACRRHRVMPYKQWKRIVEESVASYHSQAGGHDQEERFHQLMETIIGLQALEAFEALMDELPSEALRSSKNLALVAEAYMSFQQYDQALRFAEKAYNAEASSENLGRLMYLTACHQDVSHLERLTEQALLSSPPDPDLVILGVQGLLALGQQQQVMSVLNRLDTEKLPHEAKEKLTGLMAVMKKPKGALAAQLRKEFKKPNLVKSGTSLGARIAQFAAPAVILPIFFLILWRGNTAVPDANLYLVNGLQVPYTLKLNGEEHKLRPDSSRRIHVNATELTWSVESTAAQPVFLEEGSKRLHFSFWDRVFGEGGTHVLNPDASAPLFYSRIQYRTESTLHLAADPEYRFDVGKAYRRYRVDYAFREFPEEIDLGDSTSAWRDGVELMEDAEITEIYEWIYEDQSEASANTWVQSRALAYPNDFVALTIAFAVGNEQELWEKLRPALEHRPMLVELHRYYQEAKKQELGLAALEAKYKAIVAAAPEDANARYLYGRILKDPASAETQFFKAAIELDPPSAYAFYALSYAELCKGKGQEALGYLESA